MQAAKGTISDVMLDRLRLTQARIAAMADGMRQVSALPDPVGEVLAEVRRPNGLVICKTAVPLGVVAIIYESRPNVTSDAAVLAMKSGNVCVLRGGKEAYRSAAAIVAAMHEGLREAGLPETFVNLVSDPTRRSAQELMTASGLVDLLIPRGGAGLIRACVESATVPCIETGTGICHVYVDKDADLEKAPEHHRKRQDQPPVGLQRGGGRPRAPGRGQGVFAAAQGASRGRAGGGGQDTGRAAAGRRGAGHHPRHTRGRTGF